MQFLEDPDLYLVVSSDAKPHVTLLHRNADGEVVQLPLDDGFEGATIHLTKEGMVADIELKARAKVLVDFPLIGVNVSAAGAPQVTVEEIEAAWLGGDFTMKPGQRVLMLLQQRSVPPVASGHAPPSG